MEKHLYRSYGVSEVGIEMVKEYQETKKIEGYHGLRSDKRGKLYLVYEDTWLNVLKSRITLLAYNLTHRKKYRLRFKKHKGDYL